MKPTNEHKIIFVTCPTEESATNIANILVSEKLAACCNILDKIRSVYYWEGNVCNDHEVMMVIKTREDKIDRLKRRILELHNYDVPEIIALDIESGSDSYLKWIDQTLDR